MPVTTEPVLAGCHPDPSVCRFGDLYVLVTSSFGYWPGLPVHVSDDLVHWEQVGHVLTTPGIPALDGLDLSDGVWAPTVREHDGVLHVVFTVARGRTGAETYLCSSDDPAGPWSTPVRLDASGIDPALFFDVDGRCWFVACRDSAEPTATGPGEIWLRELDLTTRALVGPEHVLWHGAIHGAWVEGPRIFVRDGQYILLGAEGGTERNHAVTAATAPAVTGPWRTDPRSPLLTHRHLGASASVQNVGHADLVDTPSGETWAVVLGVRPIDGLHTLGREVFLVPVVWEATGPVFAPGARAVPATSTIRTPRTFDPLATTARDWVSLRGPVDHQLHGATHTLAPSPDSLGSLGRPALVGLRQDSHAFVLQATIDTTQIAEQVAGLVAMQHQDAWLAIRLRRSSNGVLAEVTAHLAGRTSVLATAPVDGAARLRIDSDGRRYRFGTTSLDGSLAVHAVVDHAALATEHVGGFLGVLLGLTVEGAHGTAPVVFSGVDYRPQAMPAVEPVDAPDERWVS